MKKKNYKKKSQSKKNYEAIGLFILLILFSVFTDNLFSDDQAKATDTAAQQIAETPAVSKGLQAVNHAEPGAEKEPESTGTSEAAKEQEAAGKPDATESLTETDYSSFTFSIDDIPQYSGSPIYTLNNNQPLFDYEDLTTEAFEYYSDLDQLQRCGVCYACVGTDLFPTEERGSISSVKPTGWVVSKYDFVDGKYLYNRCHLLGYQLTGENANKKNLITGTRYLNVQGMLPYENMVHDYVEDTGNHALYRVTPIFVGDELVARGVTMEAFSVEDEGEELCFYIYVYNVQPGVAIYYADGDNCEDPSTLQYAP